jgi:hypothetical protein
MKNFAVWLVVGIALGIGFFLAVPIFNAVCGLG